MRYACLAVLVLLQGCLLANASASKRLSDTVNLMNRSTRWGQLADAAHMVEPAYRPLFIANHRGWGQAIQVADSEVVHIELAPDSESALALVSYEWYLPDALNLHQTLIRQRWSRVGKGMYTLISEAVVQGDARLLGGKAVALATPSSDAETLGLAE